MASSKRGFLMIGFPSLTAVGIVLLQFLPLVVGEAAAQASCPDPKAADFEKATLIGGDKLDQPIEMAVAADGKVFVAQRFGTLMLYERTGEVSVAAKMDTYTHTGQYDVGGILGVAISPDFPVKDDWVYLYWAPRALWNGTANGSAGKLTYRLSRFKFLAGKLDSASEQIFFDIPVEWETHNGGSLKFGKDGDLYLSTGDNSCAGCNNQYSPMDERPGYKNADDQRSTANTNDLRGKILRIHPLPALLEGKLYTIPAGNLKEKYAGLWPSADGAKVRPEIYTMGHRNPYRIFPDPVTGRLYIGEFGPAAPAASERGPAGADELSMVDSASNLGYPYFLKDNQAYCHWDYALGECVDIKGQPGKTYVAARPVNASPNNTGVEILPPAKPAVLWEHDGSSPDPVSGLKACGFGAGPVYHYNPSLDSKVKFPPWFDNKWFIFGIYGGWQPKLAVVPPGPVVPLTNVVAAPFTSSSIQFSGGMHDIEFGPDGALYLLDYGQQMYANNGGDGLFRITYKGCLPTAVRDRSLEGGGVSRTLFVGGSADGLPVPPGAVRAEVFDLKGKRIWEGALAPDARNLILPFRVGTSLVRVRWTW